MESKKLFFILGLLVLGLGILVGTVLFLRARDQKTIINYGDLLKTVTNGVIAPNQQKSNNNLKMPPYTSREDTPRLIEDPNELEPQAESVALENE